MDKVVTDLSPGAMRQGVIDNLYSAFTDFFPKIPGGEKFSVGETVGYFTGVPFPLFNGVVRPRLAPGKVDGGIEAFIERARFRRVPMLWQLPPGSWPEDLAQHLKGHGFQPAGITPGMAVDLTRLVTEYPPRELSIARVRDPASIRAAASIICRVFSMPPSALEPTAQLCEAAGLHEDAVLHTYVGRVGDKLVGTSTVFYGCGVAGIYNVATLEGYRGRGIGRAMTLVPLIDARERGYRVGILHASSLGLPVYRRLGFEHYCDIPNYVWVPAPPSDAAAA